jgi:xanthine dehydrogenase accessory factor
MQEILDEIEAWSRRGDRIAIATVVATRRSAPRQPGSKMAVNERDEVAGAVSGGCVEGAVASAAHDVLAAGEPKLLDFGIADEDAWDVGLPCGGEIDVFIEEILPVGNQAMPSGIFARLAREGRRGALVTVISSAGEPRPGAKLLVREDGSTAGSFGGPDLEEVAREAGSELMWAERAELREHGGTSFFVDVTAPKPRLVILGAVDYAAALCRLARASGWLPYVCDPRSAFAAAARFPDAEEVVAAWPEEAFARIGGLDRATYVAVLTHDPKLDDAALTIALRSDAAYVGAMGSRRAQERRRIRLLDAGLTAEELDRLSAPIGLDLGATSPEETALSIMAEVVAVRNGRSGGRLRASAGRIHALET